MPGAGRLGPQQSLELPALTPWVVRAHGVVSPTLHLLQGSQLASPDLERPGTVPLSSPRPPPAALLYLKYLQRVYFPHTHSSFHSFLPSRHLFATFLGGLLSWGPLPADNRSFCG